MTGIDWGGHDDTTGADRSHREYAARKAMASICAWLTDNGITPGDVPLDAAVHIANGRITTPVHLRNRAGKHYLDPATGDIANGVITVPLKVQPPATIRAWLDHCAKEPTR